MTSDITQRNNELRVTDHIAIPGHEIEVRASRSGGPGGQHVNTSSTRVEVRWNVDTTSALSDDERARVRAKLARRIALDGTLRVTSSESRSQLRNRELATERLIETVRRALEVPKKRRRTRRPRAANEKRLQLKKERGEKKAQRRDRWAD